MATSGEKETYHDVFSAVKGVAAIPDQHPGLDLAEDVWVKQTPRDHFDRARARPRAGNKFTQA